MNCKSFFAALRRRNSGVFGTSLSQGQVRGTEALLDAMIGWTVPHTAHVLAEVYHETGGGMMPVKETVYPYSKDKNPSDATVISRLDNAWAKGKLSWVKSPYWRDGWFGRGQIQITHEYNYRKASALVGADLVRNPARALDLEISARIASEGCRSGMFTGLKLANFNGAKFDHYNARAIVNGDKGKNGKKIADYAKAFESALVEAAWREGHMPIPPDVEPPHPPKLTPQPKPGTKGVAAGGFLAAIGVAGGLAGASITMKGCEWFGIFCQ